MMAVNKLCISEIWRHSAKNLMERGFRGLMDYAAINILSRYLALGTKLTLNNDINDQQKL
jgi:hypothetical protein